jgi:hypothetical protein
MGRGERMEEGKRGGEEGGEVYEGERGVRDGGERKGERWMDGGESRGG